ncbi:FKBP-type peptidyl-prolyl cis-trans isomerase [Tellurirhabdus rosea]|uniref:FKBP-type peptidyl-prolyl cis-trans isomerase n=1 Tax=Tellurirhabdus rosea TaxID=2674997 RepID=UPI00224D2253|nr:FKBP-type peptidyl-prolyl cis-trans isomerase [Tellurirhabdus rosea]
MKNRFAVFVWIAVLASAFAACRSNFEDPSEGQAARNAQEINDYLIASGLVANIQTTSSGLTYVLSAPGSSTVTPRAGEEAEFSYRLYWLDNGRLRVADTSSMAKPVRLPYGANVMIPGLEESLSLLRVGQRGLFFMPNNLAYGGRPNTGTGEAGSPVSPVPPYSAVAFDLTLLRLRDEGTQILEYAQATSLSSAPTFQTTNGIVIYRTTTGTGPAITASQRVTLSLSGRTLRSTTPFDRRDSITVRIGGGELIAGLDSAARRLRVGDRALVLIPSGSAYGTQGTSDRTSGAYVVPPFAPVAYELQIIASRN